jgi:hypothetical protein
MWVCTSVLPIRLHTVVINKLSTGTTLFFITILKGTTNFWFSSPTTQEFYSPDVPSQDKPRHCACSTSSFYWPSQNCTGPLITWRGGRIALADLRLLWRLEEEKGQRERIELMNKFTVSPPPTCPTSFFIGHRRVDEFVLPVQDTCCLLKYLNSVKQNRDITTNNVFTIWLIWLRLALSKGPNWVGVFPHLRTETDPVSETLCFSMLFRKNPDDGQSPKTQYLCVVYIHNSGL